MDTLKAHTAKLKPANIWKMNMTHRDPREAFDDAIKSGRLSEDENAANFAGDYMYMFSDKHGDHFKHIETRKYI